VCRQETFSSLTRRIGPKILRYTLSRRLFIQPGAWTLCRTGQERPTSRQRTFAAPGHVRQGIARCVLKAAAWLILPQLFCAGCSSLMRPLPAVNLAEAGWSVRQGQAVWTLPNSKQGIAGDVVVAHRADGRSFVQFSKPFPLVIGQTTSNRWEVEFPPQNKRYSGPGSPPKRLMWLYLGRMLNGTQPPAQWTWTNSEGNWSLENHRTGEKIEGFFAQ
jgi:hypothetical protein